MNDAIEKRKTADEVSEDSASRLPLSASPLPLTACRFSVLICTYNRPDLLAQCLDALICRTGEKPDEIVVVNGGDERADAVVKGIRDQRSEIRSQKSEVRGREVEIRNSQFAIRNVPEVKLIKTINKNLAASRNVGLPHCTGDIIAMTDDDAEVFPDWVTQMKRLHDEHPEAGAIGGAVIGAASDNSLISRLADQVTFSSPAQAKYVRTLPGVNISYKRSAVDRVGPQDETLFRGEDVDYNWRVKKLGLEIYYDPSVRVLHHHRPTLRKFLNQHYMYGRAYYLVRKKWPDMYCVYPHTARQRRAILKAVNFVAAPLYEPLQYALKLKSTTDRVAAYPVLLATELAWRGGMVRQMLLECGSESRAVKTAGADKAEVAI